MLWRPRWGLFCGTVGNSVENSRMVEDVVLWPSVLFEDARNCAEIIGIGQKRVRVAIRNVANWSKAV